jgi:cell division protein FtsI (penicillin-binding protein 3)
MGAATMSAWRHYALVFALVLAALGLVGRMTYLNVTERAFLKREGDARSVRLEVLPAHRGIIFDRHGEPLAVSTPVVSVWVDPRRSDLDAADLRRLADTVGVDASALRARLEQFQGREFMYVRRRVTPDVAERVVALGLSGVHFEREYRRYYPAGETAAHLIGTTNIDDVGQEGIELAFDHHLRGRQGMKRVLKDNRRRTVRNLEYLSAPRLGGDLTLSIDLRLQYFAHRELRAAVAAAGAESGSVVVLDARTGEVLAMVNEPTFNPNSNAAVPQSARRNRAVTDSYEPGSTVKPFTLIAALEAGRYSPQTVIDTAPGFMRVGANLVQDPVNYRRLTLAEVLAKSSQVGVTKVALDLDDEAVFDALVRAGFGMPTGAGLPGEVAGRLGAEGLRSPIVRATMAFGYGMTASPLQLGQAYLSLASGGVRLPVSILRTDEAPRGERVFDAAHTAQIVHMMEGVVTRDGTAPDARVEGYQVAGKTGTARKVGQQGYDDGRHVAFFAGLAPVESPRIVVVVVINEPRGERIGGGAVAGPVFARIVARALRVLSVEPSEVRWQISA